MEFLWKIPSETAQASHIDLQVVFYIDAYDIGRLVEQYAYLQLHEVLHLDSQKSESLSVQRLEQDVMQFEVTLDKLRATQND